MTEQEKVKTCFFISPIGEPGSDVRKHADLTLNAIVRPVLTESALGYVVHRGDESASPGMISDHMIGDILDSDLCVADLTFLNPNVFYEIGIRHMASKPIIHLASVGTKIPFDNFGHRAISFDLQDWHSQEAAKEELRRAALALRSPGYVVSNPISQARGLQHLAASVDGRDQILSDLATRVAALEALPVHDGHSLGAAIDRASTKSGGKLFMRLRSGLYSVYASAPEGRRMLYQGADKVTARRIFDAEKVI